MISNEEKKASAIKALEYLIEKISADKTILIDMRFSRGVREKPVCESGPFYREFEPAREYQVEIIMLADIG
jgi:hypothetical protein